MDCFLRDLPYLAHPFFFADVSADQTGCERFSSKPTASAPVHNVILNSAELPTSLQSPVEELPQWSDVRRIYRRVCLLRATGKIEEASALENAELSHALIAARDASKAGGEEAEVLAQEAERVTSACLLAELLAPLLAEKLQQASAAASAASVSVTEAAAREAQPRAAAPSRPRRASAPSQEAANTPAINVPGIADLIDGMLSQQQASFAPARSGS